MTFAGDDGRRIAIGVDELGTLRLAYAISVHKAQGSQAPAVVVPVFRGHHIMLTRNLLYTAVTRAERVCVMVDLARRAGDRAGPARRGPAVHAARPARRGLRRAKKRSRRSACASREQLRGSEPVDVHTARCRLGRGQLCGQWDSRGARCAPLLRSPAARR